MMNRDDALQRYLAQAKRIKSDFMLKNPLQEDVKVFYKELSSKEKSHECKDKNIQSSAETDIVTTH